MPLIIAGERSGAGKTTITLALLAFLSQQKKATQSFKVGPDYIDPMFHEALTRVPARNLDPVLTSPEYVKSCFWSHSQRAEYVLVEGVMGLFDGVEFSSSFNKASSSELIANYASTAYISQLLNIPVLLVLDCSSLSGSIAAIAYGYCNLNPQVKIAGVVLNRVGSDRHLELLRNALRPLNLPILGVLRRDDKINIPDRHLGLIPSAELPQLPEIFDRLAHIGKTCFNWEKLLPLLESKSKVKSAEIPRRRQAFMPHSSVQGNARQDSQKSKVTHYYPLPITHYPIKIAVACDRAFSFYYQDNLDIFLELGAELIYWSPLQDQKLPQDITGLYFGGGFPEVFAEQLANNLPMLQQIRQVIASGIPVYAECGGLMYLCDRLVDLEQKSWSMVGAIPATTTMMPRLTLGYRQATNLKPTVLFNKKQQDYPVIWGHEFHRSQITPNPEKPIWKMKGASPHSPVLYDGWQIKQIHAAYLHLHFGEYKFLLKNFLQHCQNYRDQLA